MNTPSKRNQARGGVTRYDRTTAPGWLLHHHCQNVRSTPGPNTSTISFFDPGFRCPPGQGQKV